MKTLSSFFFRSLLVLSLLALRLPAAAQAPAWQSARAVAVATAIVTNSDSEVNATVVDATGNVYLAGSFRNTVVLGGTALTSLGGFDVFVAKFNPASNQFVWAQRAGGTSDDQATALAVRGTSIYVAGIFGSATADFGPAILTNAQVGMLINDVFVAKLTDLASTGSFIWAQRAGGRGDDRATALTVSGASVYVAGWFSSPTADFGPVTITHSDPSGFSANLFVAKLSDVGVMGNFIWVQQASRGAGGIERATALAVSGTNVYVAGRFSNFEISFGPITLTNAHLGQGDIFVAKLTDSGSTGSFVWAQRAGGTNEDEATAVAVSGTSVYLTGHFNSPTANFGLVTLTNAGSYDVFVAKLTDAGGTGSFVWAQRAGGTGDDYDYALAVSGTSVYTAGGFFSLVASFGPSTLVNAGSSNRTDAFVAKLTDAGNTGSFAWAQRAGGTDSDYAAALAVSGTGVYVAGSFYSSTADFGTTTLTNTNYYASLGFLASLTDPALTATAPSHALAPAQLYPNPAHHTATLRLPAGTAPAPLALSDALGRVVRRYPAPAGPEAALDLRGLPAGLYLLRGAGAALRLQVE